MSEEEKTKLLGFFDFSESTEPSKKRKRQKHVKIFSGYEKGEDDRDTRSFSAYLSVDPENDAGRDPVVTVIAIC